MYVAPSTSSGKSEKRYLYYRCDNNECPRVKRSIRAKIVFEYIYKVLGQLNFTKSDYKRYYSGFGSLSEQRREKLLMQIHSLEGNLKLKKADIKTRSLRILAIESETVRKINEDFIVDLSSQIEELEQQVAKLKQQVRNPEEDRLSLEQFLNLSKRAVAVAKSGSPVTKDTICRLVFLNFTAGIDEMLSYQAKPPFSEMLKMRQLSSGALAETWTRTPLRA